ncbi:MAG TPA: PEGA domain-containing protein, partial [Kofleriaceae bacterium]|nr:PEGA domain-containing protein [Kofleriaceae bacterium]
SNLLVTAAGHLKVIDFGIAKAQAQQLATQTGRVKGKLAYMAPEAISGKELDARSDLFAAGVILHELLTARPLFASKNEYQTLLKLQRGDIMPPSTFNQACPPELDAICLRALARDPDERWASAADMRDALHALRRQLNLQTGNRDIAQWLSFAFSIEAPSSSFGAVGSRDYSMSYDSQSNRVPAPAPRAPSHDEEEVVEIAWGGGEEPGSAPVVLDEVPDVSERHEQSAAARMAFSEALDDDIPASSPSHGLRVVPQMRDELDAIPEVRAATARSAGVRGHASMLPPVRPTPMPSRLTPTPMPMPSAFAPVSTRDRKITTKGTGATRGRGADDSDARAPETLDPEAPPLEIPGARHTAPTSPGDVRTARASSASFARVSEISGPIPTAIKRETEVTIGQSMIQRRAPKRTWLLLVGLAVAGAATAVAVVAIRRSGGEGGANSGEAGASRVIAQDKLFGTVKFLTEPADAEIRLVTQNLQHAGSPWATQLPPGVHQIQIQREGYKSWLTSLELSANETQTLRVVLEPMSSTKAVTEATLVLTSTPLGLEVYLDGRLLGQTPIKAQIKPGPHHVTMLQNGAEVWRQDLQAKAGTNYEFSPSMEPEKKRERAQRAPVAIQERRERTEPTAAPTPPDAAAIEKPAPAETAKVVPPATPDAGAGVVSAAVPPPPAPPKPVPAVVPRPSGPVLVPPTAVKRIAGDLPTLGKSKRAEVPPAVAAKVCINASGKVYGVDIITKLERMTTIDLTNAISTWRYEPYKQAGTATSACFVVSFRVQ